MMRVTQIASRLFGLNAARALQSTRSAFSARGLRQGRYPAARGDVRRLVPLCHSAEAALRPNGSATSSSTPRARFPQIADGGSRSSVAERRWALDCRSRAASFDGRCGHGTAISLRKPQPVAETRITTAHAPLPLPPSSESFSASFITFRVIVPYPPYVLRQCVLLQLASLLSAS